MSFFFFDWFFILLQKKKPSGESSNDVLQRATKSSADVLKCDYWIVLAYAF